MKKEPKSQKEPGKSTSNILHNSHNSNQIHKISETWPELCISQKTPQNSAPFKRRGKHPAPTRNTPAHARPEIGMLES